MSQFCFLCKPDPDLIYLKDSKHFAMLGLGPIVEGYSLIATVDHVPSMLDLSFEEAEQLCKFTETIRNYLKPLYGHLIITEHGRVPPCDYRDRDREQGHCFHAHRLVFPLTVDLSQALRTYGLRVEEYQNFIDARHDFISKDEYLYFERIDGSCLVAAAPRTLVRQFFRFKVAEYIGRPELADWKKYPRLATIKAAKAQLKQLENGYVLE